MKRVPKVVLLIETSRGYGRQLLTGIARYSRLYGPWNFYTEVPFYYQDQAKRSKTRQIALDIITKWSADGIIMRESNAEMDKIKGLGTPAIIITYTKRKFDGLISLEGDCANAGKLAAEYLLNRGFKNFAYCGVGDLYWSKERGLGFQKRIARVGHDVIFYKPPKGNAKLSWEKDHVNLTDWVRQLPKPIGVMTCTDDRGRDVIEACKVARIAVPEDVAIIGVDNDDLVCNLMNPPLSSVALNAENAGYQAAMMLHRLMDGKKVDTSKIIIAEATHVVSRQSTDVFAIEDAEVTRALRFIYDNASHAIQVKDVVNESGLQSRALQKRFRKYLGRTIAEEIDRVRIDIICRFLMETPKTIQEIADELDFLSEGHVSRFFRRIKEITPLEYRKKCNHPMS